MRWSKLKPPPSSAETLSLNTPPQPNLSEALANARELLRTSPAKAAEQAQEILRVFPKQPEAFAVLGLAQGDLGQSREAIASLLASLKLDPKQPAIWRALGDQFTLIGDSDAADKAYSRHVEASVHDPRLLEAAAALHENKLAIAERLLRAFLKEHPTDVAAIRMLAELGSRLGRYDDAEKLLARALELAPNFHVARHNYAAVLQRQNRLGEALTEAETLLKRDPRNPGYRNLKAAILARLGQTEEASAAYGAMLKEFPQQPKAWMSYGHTLKTAGHREESVAAYRKSLAQMPSLGESWWSLANLKTFRFTPDDIALMRAQLERVDLSEEDRLHLHFALGKALEDDARYENSFVHYAKGNAIRRAHLGYDAGEISNLAQRLKAACTPDFFAARQGLGATNADPIFIVGLPRSGSTLLEQILATHSAVEGTMELPEILSIVRRLGGQKKRNEPSAYPEVLSSLPRDEFGKLGEEYLERTRVYRKLGRPFFIDKMPNNFFHVGFIHLMLPNAKIIDARRHPLGCCFSCFKQHFARGQGFTYSLEDIGRYYADYAALMAHYDAALPLRVHRVFYESMVENPEAEIRRLLDYCDLPFEEACLRFYENDRAVRTASSEQVRSPIFTEGLGQWRHYEPWLGPLKTALGPALATHPPSSAD